MKNNIVGFKEQNTYIGAPRCDNLCKKCLTSYLTVINLKS